MPQTTPAGRNGSAPVFSFPAVRGKKVTAAFDGGRLTSDSGVLAQAERMMGICGRLAACIADPRDATRVVHRLEDILRARRHCQDFRVWAVGSTLRCHGLDEAFAEQDGKLGLGHGPLTGRHSRLFLQAVQAQIEQLGRRIVAREAPPRPDRPPELGVQSLDGIRRVDDPSYLFRKDKKRDHLAPRPAPALAYGGIALPPFASLEGGERFLGSLGIEGAVNALQGAGQRLAMLSGDEVHRVPEQVHDAGLDDRFGEHGCDRIGEAFEAIDDGQHEILHAPVLELVHPGSP
jgi:hypothetical protein